MRILLSVLLMVSAPDPDPIVPHPRVRGFSHSETRLIRHLLDNSETGRRLVAEIEQTDLIVYVQLTPDQLPGRAATRLAVAGPQNRYLRIVMGAGTHPRDRGALLAHELQHAVEIGRARQVRDDRTLRDLYREIGEDRRALDDFETTAARNVGAQVLREMGR
jgi:hypothetical protein